MQAAANSGKPASGDCESSIHLVLSAITPTSAVSSRISSCLSDLGRVANEKCCIDEESDSHGFSLVDNSRVRNTETLRSFQCDSNWNNPGAVWLMCNAYSVQDDYESFISSSTPAGPTYLDLRAQYNRMLAARFLEQAIALRNKGSFVESCKNLDNAIRLDPAWTDAYIERGGVKALLGRKEEALRDYDDAVRLQPDNALAHAEARILRASLRQMTSGGYRPTPTTGSSVGSSSSGAPPRLEQDRLSLIGKLQRSIGGAHDTGTTIDGSSDDSSSDDTSSSGTSDGSNASGSRDRERQRRSHKRKKHQSRRESKHRHKEKKHGKHKKEKESRKSSRHSGRSKKRRRRDSDAS